MEKAHELVLAIYRVTSKLPREERFGLTSQMRRSAISVAANIAEGFKRKGLKDKINFYNMSPGSLSELQYYLILVNDLKYINDLVKTRYLCDEIGRMLNGLIASIERLT
jgi:four helix bundle protein